MTDAINPGASFAAPSPARTGNIPAQIASGERIQQAADDPAGLAVATRLSGQIDGLAQAGSGLLAAQSFAETASAGLGNLEDTLQQMRELALQAGNGILSDADRSSLQQQFDQLAEQGQSLLQDSQFNSQPLFTDNRSLGFQSGPNAGDILNFEQTDLRQALEQVFEPANLMAQPNQLLNQLDDGLQTVSSEQSRYGALSNQLDSRMDELALRSDNTAAARSRIMDTDIAVAASEKAAADIRQQASNAVQAQANADRGLTLQLL